MQDLIKVSDSILNVETKDSISGLYEIDQLPDLAAFSDCKFYKIVKLSYEEDYSMSQAMENALSVFNECDCNLIYYINANKDEVKLYVGVANRGKNIQSELSINEYGRLLKQSIEGNFQGSILKEITNEREYYNELVSPIDRANVFSIITGVPTKENEDDEKNKFQVIDRLIHSLSGEKYQIVIVSEPTYPAEVDSMRDDVYDMYNKLHALSKSTIQESENKGTTKSTGQNYGENVTESIGTNESDTIPQGTQKSSTKGGSRNNSKGKSKGTSTSDSENWGESTSISTEHIQKEAQEIMSYIDEELLDRIKVGYRKGFFKSCIYVSSPNNAVQKSVENSIISLFQGEGNSFSPMNVKRYSNNVNQIDRKKIMKNFRIAFEDESAIVPNHITSICSVPIQEGRRGLCCYLTSGELSWIAGFPTKEISGIPLNKGVEFGLNVCDSTEEDKIHLGNIMHMGRVLKREVHLDKKVLNKHVFVAGVTGTGKTTTCQGLLLNSRLPFLVIEPAKTEYRVLLRLKKLKRKVTVFTLGNEKIAPFRINPFEILENETITSHVDMLKACFEASFEMEAAMPQILEAGIYRCYEKYGWDINDDSNKYLKNRKLAFDGSGKYFPTLSDLVTTVKEVVEEQGFDDRLKNDYIGSLVARLNGLMVGSKGQMLNCKKSIDFNWIIDNNVILELDDLKNGSDKALLMGIILARLSETLKIRHEKNPKFMHITLIEEAHRLLSNVSMNENGNKKQSVEMFCDMLAEVRKYGESLVIVDQIPNKLAPDVLKNTNTKIIHKLFAQDDKESVGDSMALDDNQKRHLSYLDTGETIMFSQGWNKPVQVKITQQTDTSNVEVSSSEVKAEYQNFSLEFFKQTTMSLKSLHRKLSAKEHKIYKSARPMLLECISSEFKTKRYRFDLERLKKFKNELNNIMQGIPRDVISDLVTFERIFLEGHLSSEDTDYMIKQLKVFFKHLFEGAYEDLKSVIDDNQEIFEIR